MPMNSHELSLLREAVSALQTVRRIENLELGSIRKLKSVEDLLRTLHNIHSARQLNEQEKYQ